MTEETQLTHEIHRAGYKVIFTPKTQIMHLKQASGGCRNYDQKRMYAHDRAVFDKKLSEWAGEPQPFEVYLENGVGDHIVFSNLIPELLKKYDKIRIACVYPDVFDAWRGDQRVELVNIWQSPVKVEDYSIYQKMIDWGWSAEDGNTEQAFRRLYLNG
jgi:hypothetical protein